MWVVLVAAILVAAVSAVLLLRVLVQRRGADRRAESWEGEVIDLSRSSPDGQNMYHRVEVRLPDGQTKDLRVRGDTWKSLTVGDVVVKRAGDSDPVPQ
jgi:hypothetical protein